MNKEQNINDREKLTSYTMASIFECLPVEIIEFTLSLNCIELADIFNFSLASKQSYNICKKNSLWKCKFKQLYPILFEKIKGHFNGNYKDELKLLSGFRKKLKHNLLALSYAYHVWPDTPTRAVILFEEMFNDHFNQYGKFYILDECYRLIYSKYEHKNLNLKYYAKNIYTYIYEKYIGIPDWESFLTQYRNNILIGYEQSLFIVAKSLQPSHRINENQIKKQLDIYAWEIKKFLRSKYPLMSSSYLKMTQSRISLHNAEDCNLILEEVHNYLRHSISFEVSGTFDYSPKDYCINKVLEKLTGNSKLLLALETCIGNRLGVYSEMHKNSHGRMQDLWKLYYISKDGTNNYLEECVLCKDETFLMYMDFSPRLECRSVDSLELCKTLMQHLVFLTECRLRSEWWQSGEPIVHDLSCVEFYYTHTMRQLFSSWRHVEQWKIRLLGYYRTQLEKVTNSELVDGKILHLNILLQINSNKTLAYLNQIKEEIGFQSPQSLRDLIRMINAVNLCANLRLNGLEMLFDRPILNPFSFVSLIVNDMHEAQGGLFDREIVQKRRMDKKFWLVKYAIGQVLLHKNNYLCVVYDWDSFCVESEDTLILMKETNLQHGTNQPFYRVLGSGGSSRYVAQESLSFVEKPTPICNPMIGRYFSAFVYPHYIPTSLKAFEYPEDANIREQDALYANS